MAKPLTAKDEKSRQRQAKMKLWALGATLRFVTGGLEMGFRVDENPKPYGYNRCHAC